VAEGSLPAAARGGHGQTQGGRALSTPWSTPSAFLGERPADGGREGLRFELGHHLHGAFGGTFGGAVAAACMQAARRGAPGLVPVSLDVSFVRGLTGAARVVPSVVHAGRSLRTLNVDVLDDSGRLSARATVGLVAPAGLHRLDHEGHAVRPPLEADGAASAWRSPGVDIPIVATLRPELLGSGPWGVATGVTTPWAEPAWGAEAVCLAADMCVGPPVAMACAGRRVPHPNPDLSLRFVGQPSGLVLAAVGRLERLEAGLAAVRIEVWSESALVGIGVSSSMLLGGGASRPQRADGFD
jgi:acyl-coenzyme A thioesterase PaaI-like protein